MKTCICKIVRVIIFILRTVDCMRKACRKSKETSATEKNNGNLENMNYK